MHGEAKAAQALAKRVLSAPGLAGDDARIAHAFRLCLGRVPTAQESRALGKLLAEARYHYQASVEEAKQAAGAQGLTGVPASETAAWAATLRIVLNMDEFITRS